VTIKDKAGNTSAPASMTAIKIDRTAPVITGKPTTSPNATGRYKDAVVVDFTCADPSDDEHLQSRRHGASRVPAQEVRRHHRSDDRSTDVADPDQR
jgi:hypothetical protein